MDSSFHPYLIPIENCITNVTTNIQGAFCNVTSDSVTCWPPTAAGQISRQPCPEIFGSPPGTFAYKRCGFDGSWAETTNWKGFGHSDYSECIGHLQMIEDVFGIEKEELKETSRSKIALHEDKTANIVFLVLLILSLVLISASLVVTNCFLSRKLNQSANYKVWRHFLFAVLMESLLRSVLEVIYLTRGEKDLSTKPAVCEILITCIEYLNSTGNMWFLIQTQLHQLTARSKSLWTTGFVTYILTGWGIPAIPTAIWSVTSSVSFDQQCWNGYEIQPVIWILRASHALMLFVTVLCLAQAFYKISKNSDVLATNCCYRRMYLESIGCIFYSVFIASVLTANVLFYQFSRGNLGHKELNNLCEVLSSVKGTVLALLMVAFNTDIRGLLEKTVRRISRQELVEFSKEENEISC